MRIKDVIERTSDFFRSKKIPSPRLDAEILISFGLNLKRIDLYLRHDQPLKESELESLRALIRRRSAGEPVAYITGEKEFLGQTFKVSPSVLIPRPETEELVEQALEWVQKRSFDHPLRVLDLGTGSGCIGLSMARKIPLCQATLLDFSNEALEIAEVNCSLQKLSDKVEFINEPAEKTEWLHSLRKWTHMQFDVILANPPYIAQEDPEVDSEVRTYEPFQALFAADNGYEYLKKWSEAYAPFLSPESIMLMEIGYQQANVMYDHFKMLGAFSDVQILKDLSGRDRFVKGVIYG